MFQVLLLRKTQKNDQDITTRFSSIPKIIPKKIEKIG